MITQKELKELLHYEPETGLFTRIKKTTNSIKVGEIAGCLGKDGYTYISLKSKLHLTHRLAWLYVYGHFPKMLDHVNRVKNDNRISNLRITTTSLNMKNSKVRSTSKSGVSGVAWIKDQNRWRAYINHHGKMKYLGQFKNKDDAIAIRKEWEEKLGYVA